MQRMNAAGGNYQAGQSSAQVSKAVRDETKAGAAERTNQREQGYDQAGLEQAQPQFVDNHRQRRGGLADLKGGDAAGEKGDPDF